MTPHVAGLDLGLTSSGLATAGRYARTTRIGQKGITLLPLRERVEAIKALGRSIVARIHLTDMEAPGGASFDEYRPDLVLIEAPDTSSRYGGLVERIQLYHEVARLLVDNRIPFGIVPSPILKGYATGNGGVDKGKKRVMAAVHELWPEYGEVNDDEADAIVLAAMAKDRLTGLRRVSAAQSLGWLGRPSIQWPTDTKWAV